MKLLRRGFFLFLGTFAILAPFAHAECYSYDDLGRLVSVVYDDANVAKRTYTLDEHGNRELVEDATSSGGVCTVPSGNTSTGQNAAIGSDDYDTQTSSSEPPVSNTPPIADDETISLLVNSSITINPLEGDTDVDMDTLSLTSITITNGSGLLSAVQVGNSVFVLTFGSTGSASISYIVSDGNGGTDIGDISITINADSAGTTDPCSVDPYLFGCLTVGEDGIIP